MTERLLVTSALPYANGPIHLGHLAGAYLPADVFVRYKRLCGADVVYVCGSDEHGAAIVMRGLKDGVSPQAIVDRYHAQAEQDFAAFGMSFDHYGRTSGEMHHRTAREWFEVLAPAFVTKTSEQMYDPSAKLFLADRFVVGTCPHCRHPAAYGDQCENCGTALSPAELIEPRSTVSDATPEMRETTHWFLPMGAHQERLEKWIGEKKHWKTNVLGQVRSWFAAGLGDRAMTRDLPWGIPVPDGVAKDAGISADGKVLYVWFDAPIGYVSATREWAEKKGDGEAWRTYWQDDDTRLVHFIGKDNIVFHTLSFPLMTMLHRELGESYVLPENVPANEFLNLEGQKLSTSRGWAVWLGEALEAFPPDYLRYSLLRSLPETKDADFSWGDFQAHINSELADNLGNLVNRTVQFVHKYGDGTVPAAQERDDTKALWAELGTHGAELANAIDEFRMREAIQSLMAIGRAGNKFFNDAEPWRTRKDDPEHCAGTLHACLQLCASLSVFAAPFLPFTAERLQRVLNLQGVRKSGAPDGTPAGDIDWQAAHTPLLKAGHALGEAEILVNKVPDEDIAAQRTKLEEAAAAAAPKEDKPYAAVRADIVFDDFMKLDLRVGRVKHAERVKKSKKLIKCIVDLGFEERQILAGVAEHMSAEELEGTQVVVVANLPPRKMVGLESQGMLLMAENREGALVPVRADSEPGSAIS